MPRAILQPPEAPAPTGLDTPMKEIMQEILTGKRDVDAFLKKLDAAWDSLRKAEMSQPGPAQ